MTELERLINDWENLDTIGSLQSYRTQGIALRQADALIIHLRRSIDDHGAMSKLRDLEKALDHAMKTVSNAYHLAETLECIQKGNP